MTVKHKTMWSVVSAVVAAAMVVSLTACGSTNQGASDGDKTVTIKVWSWDTALPKTVKGFEEKYPNIKVDLQNVGTNNDEYTALNNALQAGSGAPDVVQIEYYALSQYVIQQQLLDLSDLGAKDYGDFYTPGTWSSVNVSGGIYGLPMDSGPMVYYYNKAVYDKAGVTEVPTTWDEFREAARKLKVAGSYITSDAGDAGFYDSMIWQAGGTPFSTSDDGKTVTINLAGDDGTNTFTDYWQSMISEGLIDTKTVGWSEDWNKGLNDGSIASLLTGAWMSSGMVGIAPDQAGNWRVAQMPTWREGGTENSENGGSSLAIVAGTSDERAKAAFQFMEYATHDAEGIAMRTSAGAFPADLNSLNDSQFQAQTAFKTDDGEVEYFGGQKFNEVCAQAAQNVITGYSFLPFEVHARSIFGDAMGAAFQGNGSLNDGIKTWQGELTQYAQQQGYNVRND